MSKPIAKFRRAKEEKFLVIDELVFDNLSPFALKVYGQLRKLTSYTNQDDETEITVKSLAKLSGISERKTYDCLKELEYTHYIIQRINIHHILWGQINTFNVSQTYGRYKPLKDSEACQNVYLEKSQVESKNIAAPKKEEGGIVPAIGGYRSKEFKKNNNNTSPVDNSDQNLLPPAQYAVPPAQYAVPTAQYAVGTAYCAYLIKKQDLSQEFFKKKQNKKPVFLNIESVKTHLMLVTAKRKALIEENIIDQGIYYAYETNADKSFESVNKKLNIFLKKVREGKWLIPQGFKGITSASITDKEKKLQALKEKQWQQEANIFKKITEVVQIKKHDTTTKKLSEMLKSYKEKINAHA